MDKNSSEILSEIVIHNKYAKYIASQKRRESWVKIVDRYINMLVKHYPKSADIIIKNSKALYDKKVLPSMRAAQFAGNAIEKNNSRGYNCAFMPIDHYKSFSEAMFLLLGGTGLGYSVQYSHVAKLPTILKPTKSQKYVIDDSIEGWADAVKHLMKAYFGLRETKPRFDYSSIRAKGERLVTAGGKAPGHVPLKKCLQAIEIELEEKENGSNLLPIEVHSIMCRIADAVLAGGIRRAALIALFSVDDERMMNAKAGNWWELNPHFGRANNSAVLLRHRVTEEVFRDLWKKVKSSNSGEPGIIFTNDRDMGMNPCFVGDSMLLTSEGEKKISSLINQPNLMAINKDGKAVQCKVWSNGEKETIKLVYGTYKNNRTIKCTPKHSFLVGEEEVEAKDLLGKRLTPFFKLKKIVKTDSLKYGFLLGDGSFRKNSTNFKNIQCSFTPIKDDEVKLIFNKTGWSNNETSYTIDVSYKEIQDYGVDTSKRTFDRELPNKFDSNFMTGLFSANGGVLRKGKRVSYKTTSKVLRDGIVNYLESIGITSYYTTNKEKKIAWGNGDYLSKESYAINISTLDSLVIFAEKIGFIQSYKKKWLTEIIIAKSPKVLSISPSVKEEVFDFSLNDNTHWGVINRVVAHNCAEISLRPYSFCNLTEINAGSIQSQSDFNERARVASYFGTLQAGFTDFHYLRLIWKTTTEKDSLIGCGITGICSGKITKLNNEEAAKVVVAENIKVAGEIGIPTAARSTTIKPSGTTSLVLGVSSGIHAWYAKYYIRNIQCSVGDDLYNYFKLNHPQLIKIMDLDTSSAVIGIPQKAPQGAILREDETPIEMLERVKHFYNSWVKVGHKKGSNTNNVSATVYIKEGEWEHTGDWMWENREHFNGLSCLPYDGGSYLDAPFQECTEEVYLEKAQYLKGINLANIIEEDDNTTLVDELACSGSGSCEVV